MFFLVCASSRQHQPLVSEPRYMRDMTSAIVRVAVFHVICWLPYCIFQIFPDEVMDKNFLNLC